MRGMAQLPELEGKMRALAKARAVLRVALAVIVLAGAVLAAWLLLAPWLEARESADRSASAPWPYAFVSLPPNHPGGVRNPG